VRGIIASGLIALILTASAGCLQPDERAPDADYAFHGTLDTAGGERVTGTHAFTVPEDVEHLVFLKWHRFDAEFAAFHGQDGEYGERRSGFKADALNTWLEWNARTPARPGEWDVGFTTLGTGEYTIAVYLCDARDVRDACP
jgi:hypothetical protein